MRDAADYARRILDFYVTELPVEVRQLSGLRILEVGPGYSLGTATLLAALGANVTVADKYLPTWNPDYHEPFLAYLADVARDLPGADLNIVGLGADGLARSLQYIESDLETLPESLDGQVFDVVLSNAVLEHVTDVSLATSGLAAATSPDGLGLHQIDMRDHRDFSRPLEYLTLSESDFSVVFDESHGECGNRQRSRAFREAFEMTGFEVLRFVPNWIADSDYLTDIRGRLHPEQMRHEYDDLRTLSGFFVVQRR